MSTKPISPWWYAFMIGFLIGIIIFGVAVNSWGFFSLIPLYMVYRMLRKKEPEQGNEGA